MTQNLKWGVIWLLYVVVAALGLCTEARKSGETPSHLGILQITRFCLCREGSLTCMHHHRYDSEPQLVGAIIFPRWWKRRILLFVFGRDQTQSGALQDKHVPLWATETSLVCNMATGIRMMADWRALKWSVRSKLVLNDPSSATRSVCSCAQCRNFRHAPPPPLIDF